MRKRKKRKRSMGEEGEFQQEGMSEYERRRMENIERNEEYLKSIGLESLRKRPVCDDSCRTSGGEKRRVKIKSETKAPPRRSSRLRGVKVDYTEERIVESSRRGHHFQ